MEQVLSDVGTMLHAMITMLVRQKDAVRVDEFRGQETVVFEVRVSHLDVGRLLGQGGRTASAIRELLRSVSGQHGKHYILSIATPQSLIQVHKRAPSARGEISSASRPAGPGQPTVPAKPPSSLMN